ncbi:hypothetical protein EIP86_004973 [Pleurotus ostreatoroseus]|nr:hypothetical protein EIP86_004973 [Pleurotus ostreatoroseus]
MSLSPTTSTEYDHQTGSKRRRTSEYASNNVYNNGGGRDMPPATGDSASGQGMSPQPAHIPKRGARACTNCRKGKNRCEGEVALPVPLCSLGTAPPPGPAPPQAPCRRCQLSGTPCIFEKPEKKNTQALSNGSVDQMIGMQSSLDRILMILSQNHAAMFNSASGPAMRSGAEGYNPSGPSDQRAPRSFPPLPGFAPPPHKYATYGIVPSTAPSSDDESEDTLPRSTLNAPIEALQGLANAAAEAAAAPSASPPRVKKRKKAEPTPRNAFPHVVEKSLMERSPWTFDSILAVASKIRSGTGPLSPSFYKSLEEAQGIARSSLFGPVVRKEAVQAWSTNGWLPSGHAMRMALDLGLHRALDKLAEDGGSKKRSEEEERNLVVSARIWLCLYWFDHQMSLGTGRPIVLRDESSIRHCRILLKHPMASPTDVRLISQVELIAQKTQIYETLSPLNGQVNHNTLAFIRRANVALDKWWQDCDELHRETLDEESLPRKILAGELYYAKLWLVCVALRGVSWDKMPFEQRELAFQAKDAASACLQNLLGSPTYRAALRYAVHDSLVTAAFSGLFLLKMANLFPAELDLNVITAQVEQLAQLLSDVAAERYALTLRIMLANLRRKIGLPPPGMQGAGPGAGGALANTDPALLVPPFLDPNALPPQQPFTLEELGVASAAWANERGAFSPSAIPVWLQEQVRTSPLLMMSMKSLIWELQSLTDLGLPVNGSDGIFLQMANTNGWMGDFPPMPEAW